MAFLLFPVIDMELTSFSCFPNRYLYDNKIPPSCKHQIGRKKTSCSFLQLVFHQSFLLYGISLILGVCLGRIHFGLLSYAAGLVSRQYVAQLRARTKPAGKPDKAEAKKAAKSRKERKD